MDEKLSLRPARADDVELLAELIYTVSAGVAPLLLDGLLPGIKATELLCMALRDEHSHYSHKNCALAEVNGLPAGLLFAYDAALQHIPPLVERVLPARRMDQARDILTVSVPGSLYINTLWVSENMRGLGLSDVLLDCALALAEDAGLGALSLFVWHDNERARAFYERRGFRPVKALPASQGLRTLHPGGGYVYVLDAAGQKLEGEKP